MGQSQAGTKNHKKGSWERISNKKALKLENILRPNGMYPPEILELIMAHLDIEAVLSSSLSCKLWLETSYQGLKRLYRKEFDPAVNESATRDYRELYMKLRKAKDNLRKGLYWPEVLCSQFRSDGDGAEVAYNFTTSDNDVLFSSYKSIYDSYRSTVAAQEAYKYSSDTLERTPYEFNCLCVGQTEVYVPLPEQGIYAPKTFDVHPIGQPKKRMKIELASNMARNLLRYRKNLDGSNQLLIEYNDNLMEVYDTVSGKVILSQQFPNTPHYNVQCFYKTYITYNVLEEPESTFIIDLSTGEKKFTFATKGVASPTYFFDGKVAYGFQDTVVLFDLEKGEEIRRIVIDTSELVKGKDEIKRMLALAFDKWRLVVAFCLENAYHVVQIYDINDDCKLLQTIHDTMNISRNTELALLPNGSIVVGDTNLTVYHFNHPALYEKIAVGFYDDGKAHISLYNIEPSDIVRVALEMMNRELDDVSAITVNKRLKPDSPFTMRTTCIFRTQQEFSRVGFLSAVEDWQTSPMLWVPFALTSNEMKSLQKIQPPPYRPPGFKGSCLLVFEEFDSKAGKWKFCKPQFEENLEIIRPSVKKISVDYEEIDYYSLEKRNNFSDLPKLNSGDRPRETPLRN